ncbi:MAG: 6-carboxytetrahydropterin synthase QueD [Candidatus Omnitrophica bacterium]|nr:6-carboxytetrahydropterin synthase QueD [Candidatus Omnitrophota bacterium]
MFELTVRGEFSSAHFLRDYSGQCRNLHGHTWKVAVTIKGKTLNKIGVMADFVELKAYLKDLLAQLDHACLNDLKFFKTHNPTTENIALFIHTEYAKCIKPLKMVRVQVFESDRADVVYYAP